jgi:hypothetical protein
MNQKRKEIKKTKLKQTKMLRVHKERGKKAKREAKLLISAMLRIRKTKLKKNRLINLLQTSLRLEERNNDPENL